MWKFLHWTLTIMKEIMHKQLFTDVLQENLFWKVLKRHTQFVQNATFQLWKKNDTGCLLNFYKKNPLIFSGFSKDTLNEIEFYTTEIKQNQSISCNNASVTTSRIELTNLTKAVKSKKHSSFSVKYCKCIFFFLIISQFLPVLPPSSFSLLLSFVRNFLELLGHVCYLFTYINNISSLKTGTIPFFT